MIWTVVAEKLPCIHRKNKKGMKLHHAKHHLRHEKCPLLKWDFWSMNRAVLEGCLS